MDAATGQVGVLAAGGVLVGYPVYRSLKDTGSLPSAKRVTVPLVVVGGCALLATVAPVFGVGLAWLAALFLALNSSSAAGAGKPKPRGGASHVPGAVPRDTSFGGGGAGAW